MKQMRKQRDIRKNLYSSYGIKTEAEIASYKEFISTRLSHFIYFIEIKINYRDVDLQYTVKTNNKSAKKYKHKNSIPVIYIPELIDCYYKLINEEKVFKLFGVKFDIDNQEIYPMIIFEGDNE
jgi:hypothetical protein